MKNLHRQLFDYFLVSLRFSLTNFVLPFPLHTASAPVPSTRGSTRSRPRGTTSSRGLSRPPPSTTTTQPNTSLSSTTSSSLSHGQSGIGRGGPPPVRGSVTGVRGVRGIRSRVLVKGTGVNSGRGTSGAAAS